MTRKINFSKVESELARAIQKMNVERLLALATMASLVKEQKSAEGEKAAATEEKVKEHLIHFLRGEVDYLKKTDSTLFDTFDVEEREYLHLLEHPEELTTEDWRKIQEIREKITEHTQELRKQLPQESKDEEIVEEERKKHINKRFNVRDDWLPLQ